MVRPGESYSHREQDSPFPSSRSRRQVRGREKGRKKGVRPLPLVQFELGPWGVRPALVASPLFALKPTKAHMYSRIPVTPPVLQKIPKSLRTFPMSEYSRPIYQSLRLDHFETPRHVPDIIQDSELLRYIKTHKLII